MTALLPNPTVFLACLIALVFITPLVAYLLPRVYTVSHRERIAIACSGPLVLLAWFLHGLVLKFVGFDSVFSVIIVLAAAILIGWFAGGWVRSDKPQT